MGTLEKKDNENVNLYIWRIRYYCDYLAEVEGQKEMFQPDRVAAMFIHLLPDREPYMGIKDKFKDFHLEDGTPNYMKYRDNTGTWTWHWGKLEAYIEYKEYQHAMGGVPTAVQHNPQGLGSQPVTGAVVGPPPGFEEVGETEPEDSSYYETEDPDPMIPEFVDLESDTEMEEEEDQTEGNEEEYDPIEE